MKVSELRIGNLVKINNSMLIETEGEIYKVSGFNARFDISFPDSYGTISLDHTKSIRNYSQFDEFIEPIELTEEWLIMFGFEKKSCGYGSSKYVKGIIELHNYGGDIFKNMEIAMVEAYGSDNEEDTISVILPYDVMYVHELQNIYSIFTREELELKQ